MSTRPLPVITALYGGPGTGKSTTAAEAFALLKQWGHNVELVHEAAKGFTWERGWKALNHQGYIHGLQTFWYDRLEGEVDGIITDTSPLLSVHYAKGRHATREFREYVCTDWNSRDTLNIFLKRNPQRPYNPSGRRQSEESAIAEDQKNS